ncbi:fungal-specific transcription factor domain-containing protein [Talaromyces proteolyticus]|uniref:Fungal-specific transcription factor domain-containing protein n=1 Tax=Talaromyces proteolyticus TaxID=1131652 RepID=A0AAD4KJ51_9EURO|nr:fungal-specific transcription factor domain-containing protein [Talaromyces proteolyticus]KAH8692229.1 fungal-specific transcription factor domain-containing protein [Talaromyces proteolyticus]
MPPGEEIIIDLTSSSSPALQSNPEKKKKQNKQTASAQTFEFVSSEDAHRARSYAMRQSWRKRKQQQKIEREENVKPDRRGRQLVAKPKIVKPQPDAVGIVLAEYEKLSHKENIAAIRNLDILASTTAENIQDVYTAPGQDSLFDFEAEFFDFSNFDLPAEPLIGLDHILSPLALDPFDTFPINLTTRHHELLHHWLSSHAAMMFEESPSMDFNPMRDVWFPLDLSNAASFYGILAHAAAHLSYLHGQKHAVEVLKYKAEAVSLINKWMNDKESALNDATFAAVVRMLTFERYWGSEEAWRIHRDGLEKMIQARGGMSSLKENWRLGLVLQLISLMSKPSWFFPSNNISEISASIAYLSSRHEASSFTDPTNNNADIQKLRSLWLISFIQDMRSLMANSSNLQSEGLRHYPSIYEAVNILRTSFFESLQGSSDPASNLYEHDRITCLFYIGVMIQECVSSRYHNTIATVTSVKPTSHLLLDFINNKDASYDRLATLNSAMYEQRSVWRESISQLEAFLLSHFMNQLGNVNRAQYVLDMTEVLTSLSREARDGVERCLLNMFGGNYSLGEGKQGGWTVDQLLMSIHGQ